MRKANPLHPHHQPCPLHPAQASPRGTPQAPTHRSLPLCMCSVSPLSAVLLCLVFSSSSSLQRSLAQGWQKLSLVSLAGGRGFLARETSGAGHLAQGEFTLGSPQLEIVSSAARVPQRPNKTLGKRQVSTRWPF